MDLFKEEKCPGEVLHQAACVVGFTSLLILAQPGRDMNLGEDEAHGCYIVLSAVQRTLEELSGKFFEGKK